MRLPRNAQKRGSQGPWGGEPRRGNLEYGRHQEKFEEDLLLCFPLPPFHETNEKMPDDNWIDLTRELLRDVPSL